MFLFFFIFIWNLVSAATATTCTANPSAWAYESIAAPVGREEKDRSHLKVAIIDSGIDQEHKAFRYSTIVGKDFINDKRQAPYAYWDSDGHGTHVAGIIAGYDCDGGLIGVAPRATLYVARVCNETACKSEHIAAAIEWAIQQQVQVIHLSIAGETSSPQEIEAVKKAIEHNISVVTITGNDEYSRANSIGELVGVITVGAFNRWLERPFFSQIQNQTLAAPGTNIFSAYPAKLGFMIFAEDAQHQATELVHMSKTPLPLPFELLTQGIYVRDGSESDFAKEKVKDKIAIVDFRGEIELDEKLKRAEAEGAKAVILLLPRAYAAVGLTYSTPISIPIFMAPEDDGDFYSKNHSQNLKIQIQPSDYRLESGTSMAGPFVSGAILLLLEKSPTLNPLQIKRLLQDSAVDHHRNRSPFEDRPFGAGTLNIQRALAKISAD